jgi:hypothetical protein
MTATETTCVVRAIESPRSSNETRTPTGPPAHCSCNHAGMLTEPKTMRPTATAPLTRSTRSPCPKTTTKSTF